MHKEKRIEERIDGVLKEWQDGKLAREKMGEPSPVPFYTSFMRHWRLFAELDKHLDYLTANRDGVLGLTVGLGLAKPAHGLRSPPPHLSRPMSWEPLELASSFERLKIRMGESSGFDWRVDAVEKDPDAVKVFNAQKTVTVIPYAEKYSERDAVRAYAGGFLPGAKRHGIDAGDYDKATAETLTKRQPGRERMTIEGRVEVVQVPKYYRERIHVIEGAMEEAEIQSGRYDVALCLMGAQRYIWEPEGALTRMIAGLREGGLLFTDQTAKPEGEGGRILFAREHSLEPYEGMYCYRRL
jgi:hypothetical protein